MPATPHSRPLTASEYAAHLDEQLDALQRAAQRYDDGDSFAALQMAVSIRVLFHDTPKSASLLAQMGKKTNLKITNTVTILDKSDNPLSYHPLVSVASGNEFWAMLDTVPSSTNTIFDDWWKQVVFRGQSGISLRRQDLILIAANKAGGAHVDPNIDSRYADLSSSLGWKTLDGQKWVDIFRAERAAIRQITHEVLKTLIPGYGKTQDRIQGHAIGGISLNFVPGPKK